MGNFDELVASQFGLLTRGQALQLLGLSRFEYWVRTGRLIRVATGLYRVAGAPATLEQTLFGRTLIYGGYAGFRGAGALHDFNRYRELKLEVVVPHGTTTRRKDGQVALHHSTFLPASHVTEIRGIPATTAARTACDLSAVLGVKSLGKLIDDAVRRKLLTYDEVRTCRNELRARGRRRTTVLDEFLELRGFGFDPGGSDPELKLGDWLEDAGLPPVRQHPVILSSGKRVLDCAYPAYKVGAEYIGIDPHSQPFQVVDDSERTTELQLAGWFVALITKGTGRRHAVAQVREALQQRGWPN